MSATLVKSPVRMSRSMTSGHDVPNEFPIDSINKPLGYLYSDWTTISGEETTTDIGRYDPQTQTWVDAPDVITMGQPTRTRIRHCGIIRYVVDDACF